MHLSVVIQALRLQVAKWHQFRLDYAAGLVAVLLEQALTLSIFGIVYTNVPHIHGWTLPETLLLYGFTRFALGIADAVGENLWWVGDYAQSGQLTLYQLRPISVLLQLCIERIHFERLLGSVLGLGFILYGLSATNVAVSFLNAAVIIVFLCLSTVIYFALMVFGAAISVTVIGGGYAIAALWSLTEFANYPTDIFGRVGIILLSTVFPLSVVGFVPAVSVLPGKSVKPLFVCKFPPGPVSITLPCSPPHRWPMMWRG